ncbi:MAG: response regulator [Lachnospiraceae bacterium]|nr:response regulator [Lachnospiraceae bacterium]
MLIFQIGCLMVTYLALQYFISKGVYSRKHRLLPVVLVLVAVFNFYQIFQNVMGEYSLFAKLEDILIVQILCLLIYYIMELYQIKKRLWAEGLLFACLIIIDIIMIEVEYGSLFYYTIYAFSALLTIGIIMGLVLRSDAGRMCSRQEQKVNGWIFGAIGIGGLFFVISPFVRPATEFLQVFGFLCMDMIIWYLLWKGWLVDTSTLMQENILDISDVAYILFDEEFCYIGASRAAMDMLSKGLSKISRFSNYYKGVDRLRELVKMESQYREAKVDNRYYTYKLTPLGYKESPHGYVLTMIDITQQKLETQAMEKLKKEAETQILIKSNFMARMTHELRSPLHAIISLSDILMENREISKKNRSLLMHVKNAGVTLSELVNAILLFSKLENGKLKLLERRYELEKLIEELSYISVVNLKDKPVSFKAEFINQHPRYFIGDDLRVREMIQNLLSNAVKFTQKGEIRCEIFCGCSEEDIVKVTCRVTDTGLGMKPDEMQRVFQEYVSFADNKQLEGTGLGLSIVKQLADLMGGEVSVKNNLTGGSEFEISFYQRCSREEMLPPKTYTKDNLFKQSVAWSHTTKPTWTYSRAKVLVADDMQVNLLIFKEFAKTWQFEVETVEGGKKALELALANHYDMIFLDLLMPDLGGDEVAKQISAQKEVPLVLLTANLTDDLKEQYTKYGFTEFLSKPLEGTKFKEIVERNMPVQYRENYVQEDSSFDGNTQIYRQALESFVREVKPLMEHLQEYMEQDMDMFRIKVHGIKGAARQIGKLVLSEDAEIMEMAAKTYNISYLERKLEDFLEGLKVTLEEIEEEISLIPNEQQTMEADEIPVIDLYRRIMQGFDDYDLDEIEKGLTLIGSTELSLEERELVTQLREAYLDLEYEKGAQIAGKAIELVSGRE